MKQITQKTLLLFFLLILQNLSSSAQETNTALLDAQEQKRFRELIAQHNAATEMYDSICTLAEDILDDKPSPLTVLHYEGMLDTNPKRVITSKSLDDINKILRLVYSSYGTEELKYGQKIKEYVLAWAKTYQPNGNTINENKFNPLFWGFYLNKKLFSKKERELVEKWMVAIAEKQIAREHTPNNNWMAKRYKIIGIVGCITDNEEFKNIAIAGQKTYISTAYFADGTSNDLRQRDALHYHVGGLKPAITTFINCGKFDKGFELFDYESPEGASIKKSVEYIVPYALGEKMHKEWVNTKVALDKERAAAGIAKYQPGILFEKHKAYPTFEWACFYNAKWFSIFEEESAEKYMGTWIGLLNSPLIRN